MAFLWPPDTLARTELKALYHTYTPHTELPATDQPRPLKKWQSACPLQGEEERQIGHLLTISIYSSCSVMVNTFLGNTANSCKNSCRSEEQKREDATSEHADYPTDSDGLTAASSSPSSYPVYEESESPVKKPNTALPGRLKHPTHSILPQWNLLHDGCFRLLRTRNMQTHLKPRTREEQHLKATRQIKKGARRLRTCNLYAESIFPASLLNATLVKTLCWRKRTQRRLPGGGDSSLLSH